MGYTLITGASSGIGYELATVFAEKEHSLILIARRENKLKELAKYLQATYQVKALVMAQDLSHNNSAEEIYRQLQERSIDVDYLVNNAGFYVKGAFSDTSWKQEHDLIQLQCITHTQLVKCFLPQMLKKGRGGILTICSTGSFVPGPYNAIYCAAKSFLLSFSEALAEEVAGSGIRVTAICPGGVKTNFQDLTQRKSSLCSLAEASEVARSGYRALMKGKRVAIPGICNQLQIFLLRLMPRNLVAKLTGSLVNNKNADL